MSEGCGIYAIRNLVTGWVYIGSAARSFRIRWNSHRQQLRHNKHKNKHLQQAWNKHTEAAFAFDVLEYVSTRSWIVEREQHWLQKHYGHKCYNQAPNACTSLGRRMSPEARQKIARARAGQPRSEETKRRISEGRRGVDNSRHDAAWRAKVSASLRGRPSSQAATAAMLLVLQKTYDGFVAPDGTIYKNITGLRRFCREHDLGASEMSAVYSGRRPHHKGWKRYKVEATC